ncbi:hypothetical protein SAMN02745148_00687 [Modicisalibacter ilicicola DSM 19980]|uniref:Uncharacterized protein n=1 Tax=Modicisalibacter ilicicola DSM 19980 TaxID=1121942 RepID=A0A1M4UM20_9GAMM|nr:hypothetical protein [Halomonas ilicicola]SHE57613.1 hypothetical protein SAMN02745148_00687 [Halomonas ilicicola DSM 19980]
MIWHLIAAAFAGLGAAGVGLLLRFISGNRLPRWVVPVFAGLGMLAYQIHYEYSWFDAKREQLPESATVVSTQQEQMLWRPWTYLFPMTTAFDVVDQDSLVRSRIGGESLVEFILYRFEKGYQDRVTHQAYLINCAAREKLPISEENRQPDLSGLQSIDESTSLFQAICPDA